MTYQLSSNPNLTYYKNRTKDLHKAYKGRSTGVCEILRYHEKLQDLSDEQLFSEQLKLADIQHAYARSYGFKNWAALKLHATCQ